MEFVKPYLKDVPIYTPGKSLDEVKREYGLETIHKLASNENPLGPSPKAIEAMNNCMKDVFYYPDPGAVELKEKLAAFYKSKPEEIMVGNGSEELIDLICRTFADEGDEVLTSEYSFEKYFISTKLMRAIPVHAKMKSFTYDLDALYAKISDKTKVIFLANPNNPTGTLVGKLEMKNFLNKVPENIVIVLDEAYYEYGIVEDDYPNSLDYDMPNLVTMRTFSKAYGLAGLRIGYVLAKEDIINQIAHARGVFTTNLFAQKAAIAGLDDQAHVKKAVDFNRRERSRVESELAKLQMKAFPSATNFLFLETPIPGLELAAELLKKGIIIRPIANYGLMNHVRISIGLEHQNDYLIECLQEILKD